MKSPASRAVTAAAIVFLLILPLTGCNKVVKAAANSAAGETLYQLGKKGLGQLKSFDGKKWLSDNLDFDWDSFTFRDTTPTPSTAFKQPLLLEQAAATFGSR